MIRGTGSNRPRSEGTIEHRPDGHRDRPLALLSGSVAQCGIDEGTLFSCDAGAAEQRSTARTPRLPAARDLTINGSSTW